MRFLADMGIARDVIEHLREHGHDAMHLSEQGLQRLPDESVLAKAALEGRVLLTHDLDMGQLLALARAKAPSLVTFRLSDMRPVNVIPHLGRALQVFGDELKDGAALSVTDRAIRCHSLPLISD